MVGSRYVILNGSEIRLQRHLRGWSQEVLAEVSGIVPRTIQHAEAGDRVEWYTANAIARVLDVDVRLLLHRGAGANGNGGSSGDLPATPQASELERMYAALAASEAYHEQPIEADWAINRSHAWRKSNASPPSAWDRLIRTMDGNNRTRSFVTRAVAHSSGLLHGSVLLLLRDRRGRVLAHRWDAGKPVYAGKVDGFGGHEEEADLAPLHTALRVANEELPLYCNGRRRSWTRDGVRQCGVAYRFEEQSLVNVERSTLFLLDLPRDCGVEACEIMTSTGTGGPQLVPLASYWIGLHELMSYKPESYADGLRRVRDLYLQSPRFSHTLNAWGAGSALSDATLRAAC